MAKIQLQLTISHSKQYRVLLCAALMGLCGVSPQANAQSTNVSSDAIGYYRFTINPGFQTVSISLINEASFTSTIGSSTSSTISSSFAGAQLGGIVDTTKKYYVEVTDGPNSVSDVYVGHRFEVDEAATFAADNNVISIETVLEERLQSTLQSVPDLSGYQMELREHVVLNSVFNKANFSGGGNVGSADQLLIFNGTIYETYYLFQSGAIKIWLRIGAGFATQDEKPLYPNQGILFKRKTGQPAVPIILKGKVRSNPFVQPLIQGFNLISEGFPISISPTDRDAAPGDFTGASGIGDADQVSIYNGTTYDTYYLFNISTFTLWRKLNGGFTDYTDTDFFEYNKAVFLKRQTADSDYRVPLPWQP